MTIGIIAFIAGIVAVVIAYLKGSNSGSKATQLEATKTELEAVKTVAEAKAEAVKTVKEVQNVIEAKPDDAVRDIAINKWVRK